MLFVVVWLLCSTNPAHNPGVDEGLNQFIHGQTPMHTDPPPMVDISQYPDTAETKGASSTALFNKYSTTITKNGERLDSITVNQPNLWLTEMKQDQDGTFVCVAPSLFPLIHF